MSLKLICVALFVYVFYMGVAAVFVALFFVTSLKLTFFLINCVKYFFFSLLYCCQLSSL